MKTSVKTPTPVKTKPVVTVTPMSADQLNKFKGLTSTEKNNYTKELKKNPVNPMTGKPVAS